MEKTILSLNDFAIYNNKENSYIIKEIHFKLKEKEIAGIIGNSGEGKSSLLLALCNMLDESLQSNHLGAKDKNTTGYNKALNLSNTKKIGMLPQDVAGLFSPIIKLDKQLRIGEIKQRKYVEIVKILKIEKLVSNLNKYCYEFSLGELQRLAILGLFSANYEILLLDEPSAFLDLDNQELLKNLIRVSKEKYRQSFIIATHNIDFAQALCDNIYLLHNSSLQKYKGNSCFYNKEDIANQENYRGENKTTVLLKDFTIYKGNNKLLYLKDFMLYDNENIVITGASGSGKTLLLSYLASLLGNFRVEAEIIENNLENSYLLNQDYSLSFDNKQKIINTLLETLNIKNKRKSKFWKLKQIIKLSHKLQLKTKLLKKYPMKLSQGEKQRVALLRILLLQPRYLLLDEFTSNLDINSENSLINFLIDFQKENKINYIITTHSKNVKILGDRFYNL